MKLSVRSPLLGVTALSLALGAAQWAGATPQQKTAKAARKKTPPPKVAAAPRADAAPARYEFEKRKGALEEALTALLAEQRPALPEVEEAGQRMARAAGARRVIRSNAGGAATTVIAELERLPKDDIAAHAELFSLLAAVGDEGAAIDYWSRVVMTGQPRRPQPTPRREKLKGPDQPRGQRSEHQDPQVRIRYLAMAQLYRAARAGSEKARAAILEAAASPHREVRISAVQYTYSLTRRRWKARQELARRLPRGDEYLLHRY